MICGGHDESCCLDAYTMNCIAVAPEEDTFAERNATSKRYFSACRMPRLSPLAGC